MAVQNDLCIPDLKDKSEQEYGVSVEEEFDYTKRGQWLCAVKQDVGAMVPTGFAGLVAGVCSMTIGEFVSVYSQRYIEVAQVKRETAIVENEKSIHLMYRSSYYMFYLI
ncbi:vacuolar iron transporter homolog 2 [Lactuca sativa]|uniref:Vacuolar iron transporter n=1 Tax=Lactuca sativa TaxID=4236 RepID=A0A9R1VHE8_LACSA|nr:vacuolar iron transporter homolog 2 [Lactuca sativa]KAJ0205068.1 hypothetical protein LSAT_V11C500267190 [Lactuca sativa]